MRTWVLLLLALLPLAGGAAKASVPNVVIINADDMGWGDLGCYGNRVNPTPNLDRLASQGMRFTSFYAAQAVCTSSRVGLMTGCYPNRLGLGGIALGPSSKLGLAESEQTMGTIFRQAGYRTCAVGKWHLGDAPQFLPPAHGFDESMVIPYSNDMWPKGYFPGDESRKMKYPPLPRYTDGYRMGLVDDWADMDELTSVQGFRGMKFIRDLARRSKPFFLYLATSMPHTPLGASKDFKGKGPTPYAETLADLDRMVGAIMRVLDDMKVAENTILIFTSDNGPWLNFGKHAGSAGHFREGKGTTFEGGVRVPLIVRWPGKVEAGSVSGALSSNIDLLPTVIEACGLSSPALPIDGLSFLPVLKGERAKVREDFAYYYGDKLEAVRVGRWKLHLPHKHRSYEDMVFPKQDGAPAETKTKSIDLSLYDLVADPGERVDVKDRNPEVVNELKAFAEKERKRMDAAKRPVGRAN
ncbi:MAG: sulfatase [Opitutales bacterium]